MGRAARWLTSKRRHSAGETASDRARTYFQAGASQVHPFAASFFADIERFESTRNAWVHGVVEPFLDRFVELVELAEVAGEIRPVNTRFLQRDAVADRTADS